MATQTALPEEAVDITASELHQLVLNRLVDALRSIFGDRALVLSDVFLRVRSETGREEQASPDVAIIPGARPGTRSVYRVPDEPVPAVTVEVLSPVNRRPDGAAVLAEKRALFGRTGVPVHIEVDPDLGQVTIWANSGTELVAGEAATACEHPALGGLRIEVSPMAARLFLPDGREFVDAQTEMARAEREAARAEQEAARAQQEAARADQEAARADQEAARAQRFSDALKRAGVDPTAI